MERNSFCADCRNAKIGVDKSNATVLRYGHSKRNATVPQTEYPDRRRKDTMNDTTAKEIDRLADWLRAQGMTPAQVLDCLKYIAGTTPPTASAGK